MLVEHQARQGDILFIRIDDLPKNLKVAEDRIVAHGEVTGHAHRVAEDPGVVLLEPDRSDDQEDDGKKYVTADKNWKIVHDEHKAIEFVPAKWEARRQREYAPDNTRFVYD